MENQFYSKDNYDVLYTVVLTDLERQSISSDDLQVNVGEIIYENMETCWSSKKFNDTVEKLNKRVLDNCLPEILSHVNPTMIADEQVKVFIDNESTNLTNVDVSAEDLEGTLLHTKDEPTEPTQS